jgi:hypothetical protein
MDKSNFDKESLKIFGITMGIVFLVFSLLILIKNKYNILPTSIIAVILFVFALIAPIALKPIYIIWMKFAFILGWINTRLILFILFYLILTPMSLGLRLCGVRLLDRKIEKNKNSYWISQEKNKFKLQDYEKQF